MRKNSVLGVNNTNIKISYLREDIFGIIAKSQRLGKVKDSATLPEILMSHYRLWYEDYPNDKFVGFEGTEEEISQALTQYQENLKNRRNVSLNKLCDDIIAYLSSFTDLDERKTDPFRADNRGLLRQNLLKFSLDDQVVPYTQELIQYVHLLSLLPSDERNETLGAFPASLKAQEYKCLEGTRDRLQPILLNLTKVELPLLEQRLLEAHNEIIEENRRKCHRFIQSSNQSHLSSAIQYICGFEDDSRNHAKATSFSIPMDYAWQIYKNYITDLKKVFETISENRILHEIQEIEEIVDKHTDNEGFANKDWVGLCQKLEIRGISVGDITVVGDKKEDHRYKWNRDKIAEVTKRLEKYKTLDICDPLSLSNFPNSLFEQEIPSLIANLLSSPDLVKKKLGARMLLMLGHDSQLGNSPIQFLNSINEIGKISIDEKQEKTDLSAFTLGIIKLQELQTNHSYDIQDQLDIIIARGIYYQNNNAANNHITYIDYLASGSPTNLPPIKTLINGNAPAELIIAKLQIIQGEIFNLDTSTKLKKLYHNPQLQKIISSILSDLDISDEDVVALGQKLVSLASSVYDLEIINYVKSAFIPKDRRTNIIPLNNAKITKILYDGLTINDGHGLKCIAKYDAIALRDIIAEQDDTILLTLLEYEDSLGESIILYLIMENHKDSLEALIDLIPNKRKRDILCKSQNNQYGYTCLHWAAQLGLDSIVILLLSQKDNYGKQLLNPDILDKKGYTPLMRASQYENIECINILLQFGANTQKKFTRHKHNALHVAAKYGRTLSLVTLLSAQDANGKRVFDPNTLTASSFSPLMCAARNGHIDSMKILLDFGANLTEQNRHYEPYCTNSLHIAAEYGLETVLRFLLSLPKQEGEKQYMLNLNINGVNQKGSPPIFLAAQWGHANCVRILLDFGANPLRRWMTPYTSNGFTPLHAAANNGHASVIKEFALEQNTNKEINLFNELAGSEHHAPLYFSVKNNHLDCTIALLESGHCHNLNLPIIPLINDSKRIAYGYRELQTTASSIAKEVKQRCLKDYGNKSFFAPSFPVFDTLAPYLYHKLAILYKGNLHSFKLDLNIDAEKITSSIEKQSLHRIIEVVYQCFYFIKKSPQEKYFAADAAQLDALFRERETIRSINKNSHTPYSREQEITSIENTPTPYQSEDNQRFVEKQQKSIEIEMGNI